MQIDKALILKLEKLSRLQLSETERARIQADLNNILGMVEKLQELDLSEVEPLVYITEEVNVLREDEVKHQVNREAALSNAPDRNEEYFKIAKVIDLNGWW